MDLVTGIWKLYRGCIDVEVAVNFTHITPFGSNSFCAPPKHLPQHGLFPCFPIDQEASERFLSWSCIEIFAKWGPNLSPPVPHKDRHHVWSEAPYRCTWLEFFCWPSDQVVQKNIMISIDLWDGSDCPTLQTNSQKQLPQLLPEIRWPQKTTIRLTV